MILIYGFRRVADNRVTRNYFGLFNWGSVIVGRGGLGIVQHLVGTLLHILDRVIVRVRGIVEFDDSFPANFYRNLCRFNANARITLDSHGIIFSKSMGAGCSGLGLGRSYSSIASLQQILKFDASKIRKCNITVQMPNILIFRRFVRIIGSTIGNCQLRPNNLIDINGAVILVAFDGFQSICNISLACARHIAIVGFPRFVPFHPLTPTGRLWHIQLDFTNGIPTISIQL